MSHNEDERNKDRGTWTALFALFIISSLLILLIANVFPGILGFILVVWGIVLFVCFHYLVWGRWMSKWIVKDDDDDDDDDEFLKKYGPL